MNEREVSWKVAELVDDLTLLVVIVVSLASRAIADPSGLLSGEKVEE